MYARACLGIGKGASNKQANPFDRFVFTSGRLPKISLRRRKGLRYNTANRRRRGAVALKHKLRRKLFMQYKVGLSPRSCASLFI